MGCGATKQKLPRESRTKLERKRSQKHDTWQTPEVDVWTKAINSVILTAVLHVARSSHGKSLTPAFEEVEIGTSFPYIGILLYDFCQRATILFSNLKEWLWNKTSKCRNLINKTSSCSVMIPEAFLVSRTKDSKPAVDGVRRRLIFDLRIRQSCRQTTQAVTETKKSLGLRRVWNILD